MTQEEVSIGRALIAVDNAHNIASTRFRTVRSEDVSDRTLSGMFQIGQLTKLEANKAPMRLVPRKSLAISRRWDSVPGCWESMASREVSLGFHGHCDAMTNSTSARD